MCWTSPPAPPLRQQHPIELGTETEVVTFFNPVCKGFLQKQVSKKGFQDCACC